MNKAQQFFCGLTVSTAFSGLSMQEKATASVYCEPNFQAGATDNAVFIDGQLVFGLTAEDIADIAAALDGRRSGPATSFDEFCKELGI